MSRSEGVAEYLVERMPFILAELRDLVIPAFECKVAAAGRKATDPSAFVEGMERAFAEEIAMYFCDIAAAVDRKVCAMCRIEYADEEIVVELHDHRSDPCTVLISAPEVIAPVKDAMARVAKQHLATRRHRHRQRAMNVNS